MSETTTLAPKDMHLGPGVIGKEQWEANQKAIQQQGKNPSGAGPQVIMTPQEYNAWLSLHKDRPEIIRDWQPWLEQHRAQKAKGKK